MYMDSTNNLHMASFFQMLSQREMIFALLLHILADALSFVCAALLRGSSFSFPSAAVVFNFRRSLDFNTCCRLCSSDSHNYPNGLRGGIASVFCLMPTDIAQRSCCQPNDGDSEENMFMSGPYEP